MTATPPLWGRYTAMTVNTAAGEPAEIPVTRILATSIIFGQALQAAEVITYCIIMWLYVQIFQTL